jgi:hypothetical protein
MARTLFIVNDAPCGTAGSDNGPPALGRLSKRDSALTIRGRVQTRWSRSRST